MGFPLVPPKVFTDPDSAGPQWRALLIGALDRMAASPEVQRVRQRADEALAPRGGQNLLDAGCGVGEVVRDLATLVAPGGTVTGVDLSAAAVAVARERAAARPDLTGIRYGVADISALPFADGSFDGVRSERVLQHLTDPDRAVAELIRVTRPGGRVCLVDTDWHSFVLDGPPQELADAVTAHFLGPSGLLHGARAGRTLRGRLVRAGLAEVGTEPVTVVFTEPDRAAVLLPMIDPRVPAQARFVPDDRRDEWFDAIDASGRRGDFLAALTIWVAAGTRVGG